MGFTGILLLITANLLIPFSLLIFASGFFPYKPFLPGLAQYEDLEFGPPPDGPFDKLVFMVVDALRSDFVFSEGSGFEYTQSLIRDGSAVPFTANARTPTVTMPRLKSMTTGSIPSFVDLILNINEGDTSSSLAVQDTWLAQLKANDFGKLLMFGDDTWLKLFPDTFDREDGTSSFFVSDFTEVDNNVTRNIEDELKNDDWGLMVLHYLGLDHIGHKSGPRSVNMVPKQREMDGIVQDIFTAMESNENLHSTLFVMCGDHGMNDAGNHGASSPGETSSALLFMSPKMKQLGLNLKSPVVPKDEFEFYSKVEQSDLAPTIAGLLGFPVSKNNLGAFIPDFLPFFKTSNAKVQVLVRNARQILEIVTAAFGADLFSGASGDPCSSKDKDEDINALACEWRRIKEQATSVAEGENIDAAWLASTSNWLREAQDLMSSMASNYNMSYLFPGVGLGFLAACLATGSIFLIHRQKQSGVVSLLVVTVPYGIMMFASSFVEEEHHYWYWFTSLWLAYLGSREIRASKRAIAMIWPVVALFLLRVIRAWNQTGQKFAGDPDIVKTYLIPHPQLLWILVLAMYILAAFQISQGLEGVPPPVVTFFTAVLTTSALAFKLAFTSEDAPELDIDFAKVIQVLYHNQSLVFQARIVFVLIGACTVFAIIRSLTGGPRTAKASAFLLHNLCAMLVATQSRATNIPLLFFSSLLLQHIAWLRLSVAEVTITSILLQFTTFFAYGGTNAISSVDLSSAYNGISDFNVVAVGILTFVSNWAGPVFWTTGTNILLLFKFWEGEKAVFQRHAALLTAFTAISTTFAMAACIALRTHLFIWTVFSPKYLYCLAWSLGQHLVVNLGLGGALFWLGAR